MTDGAENAHLANNAVPENLATVEFFGITNHEKSMGNLASIDKIANNRNAVKIGREEVIKKYMDFYDKLISDTMRKNNTQLYKDLK